MAIEKQNQQSNIDIIIIFQSTASEAQHLQPGFPSPPTTPFPAPSIHRVSTLDLTPT